MSRKAGTTQAALVDNPSTERASGERQQAVTLLEFLNEKAGRRYEPVEANLRLIRARLGEYGEVKLRKVVVRKCREWAADEKMARYLRPATLFNAEKCAQYVGELVPPAGISETG